MHSQGSDDRESPGLPTIQDTIEVTVYRLLFSVLTSVSVEHKNL